MSPPSIVEPPLPGTSLSARERWWSIAISLGFSLAILSPIRIWFDGEGRAGRDDFPLSYYPMFADPRPEYERFTYVVAVGPDNARHVVPYRYYARGGMNQGRAQINKTRRQGGKALRKLCRKVARRLARQHEGWEGDALRVEVVTGRYELARYFGAGDLEPVDERVHTTCPVERETSKAEPHGD